MTDFTPVPPLPTLRPNRLGAFLWARWAAFSHDWTQPAPFDWRSTLAILLGALALMPLLLRLPNLGFEWYHFDRGTWNATYPPWMPLVLTPLTVWDWRVGLALLTGLLLMSVAVGAAREARTRGRASMLVAALLAVTTAPVFMIMWLGNAAIVVLFGIIALPFGLPLATIQPHLAPWAILARRGWVLWGIGFLLLTFLGWGFWPLRYRDLTGLLAHPIAMGWQNLGWPLLVGLVMLPFTTADPLRLMAVGAFLTPYLMPVHLVLLAPAIGRTRGRARLLLWLTAWLALLPPMFLTPWAKYLAMGFPLAVWWLLRPLGQR